MFQYKIIFKMNFLRFFIVLSGILIFNACSNDFELTENSEPLPVVYGVISAQDTAIYIRVEKSFVSQTISGKDLALDASNLYYDDANVILRHQKSGQEFTLTKVDGNLEGFPRDKGSFADAPNYLYKIKRNVINLIPGDEYKLIVRRDDGQVICEATTPILKAMSDDLGDVPAPSLSAKLSFIPGSSLQVSFFPDINAVIHDIIFTIHYREIKNGITEKKSVDWKAAVNISNKSGGGGHVYGYLVPGRNFFQFLAGVIPASDPLDPVDRVLDNIDMSIISGGEPIKDYINIGLVNLGITSSGEIPVYSNISNNGRGLFSSKTTYIREGMALATGSLSELRTGEYTKQLNFK